MAAERARARVEQLARTTSSIGAGAGAGGAGGGGASAGGASLFGAVPLEAPDAIFGLSNAFKADPAARKVDLVIGAYRDDAGRPWVLPAVREAERRIAARGVDHEYLGIDGLKEFTDAAATLLIGAKSAAIRDKRVISVQSLSGSGAVRLGADFLAKFLPGASVYIPDQTWANHRNIFTDARIPIKTYRYYNAASVSLNFDGMLEDLKAAPPGSLVLLHVCAHNPTGIDPSRAQWMQIADVVKTRKLFPFFDSAYQGFATGDLEGDAFSLRAFEQMGIEFLVAQSFAKNMGLYGERTGCLHVVVASAAVVEPIRSQLKRMVRGSISSPPTYGARIAATILNDPALYQDWVRDVVTMADRIKSMRTALYNALLQRKTPGNWTHITSQIGMFTFSGLTAAQCQALMDKHHIYLMLNGRISMAGLNTSNVNYVADAIHAVVTNRQ